MKLRGHFVDILRVISARQLTSGRVSMSESGKSSGYYGQVRKNSAIKIGQTAQYRKKPQPQSSGVAAEEQQPAAPLYKADFDHEQLHSTRAQTRDNDLAALQQELKYALGLTGELNRRQVIINRCFSCVILCLVLAVPVVTIITQAKVRPTIAQRQPNMLTQKTESGSPMQRLSGKAEPISSPTADGAVFSVPSPAPADAVGAKTAQHINITVEQPQRTEAAYLPDGDNAQADSSMETDNSVPPPARGPAGPVTERATGFHALQKTADIPTDLKPLPAARLLEKNETLRRYAHLVLPDASLSSSGKGTTY
jgi:hypothetical protein